MSRFVGNPEDRFCRGEAHIVFVFPFVNMFVYLYICHIHGIYYKVSVEFFQVMYISLTTY